MLKKILTLSLVIITVFSLVSCTKNTIFETSYYKDEAFIYTGIPETSKSLGSYEADFDKCGENERLEVILCGQDDNNAQTRPIRLEMYKKDFDGNMTLVNLVYPNDVNSPVIYDGYLSKDRIDVFVDETDDGAKIYFEESGLSNNFSDFKSFYYVGYEFKDYNFQQMANPISFIGSYPDLYEAFDLINQFEDPNAIEKLPQTDYDYLIRFKDSLNRYNLPYTNYGYDYPVINKNKELKLVSRTYRTESNISNSDNWLNSDNTGPFGKVVIYQ